MRPDLVTYDSPVDWSTVELAAELNELNELLQLPKLQEGVETEMDEDLGVWNSLEDTDENPVNSVPVDPESKVCELELESEIWIPTVVPLYVLKVPAALKEADLELESLEDSLLETVLLEVCLLSNVLPDLKLYLCVLST